MRNVGVTTDANKNNRQMTSGYFILTLLKGGYFNYSIIGVIIKVYGQ